MNGSEKIVDFEMYCPLCKYYKDPETVVPCHECLIMAVNIDSHRPVYFEWRKSNETSDNIRNL